MIRQTALPWLGVLIILTGCSSHDVNSIYGRRRGTARSSVNGTSVLGEMFRQAGYQVTTWRRLSPRLERSDVIVWTPNSFELPSSDEIEGLENWLTNDQRRTMIYVGRDYDAAIDYWKTLAEQSRGGAFIENRRRLARAQADHALLRSYTGKALECEWFSVKSRAGFTPVPPTGPWAEGIDREKAKLVIAGQMSLPESATANVRRKNLLESDQGPLIVQVTSDEWGHGSKLILVVNGSPLLNFPLIDQQNRMIAGKLIEACGTPGRVTFLESGSGGIPISDRDPHAHTGFEILTVWPISSILLHLIIAGILYCAMVFPIFGKARDVADDSPNDFGKHIHAMGELLSYVNDRETALEHLRHYRQLTSEKASSENEAPSGNPFQPSIETPVV